MDDYKLIEIAEKAKDFAYAPYSKFRVGAAVLCGDGSVFTGCNIENATYGATICAERCAVFKAISQGHKDLIKIAIMSDSKDFTMPCGICRQVLFEFMPNGQVLVSNHSQIKIYSVSELIPECFSLD